MSQPAVDYEELLQRDNEYRRLSRNHQLLKERLQEMDRRTYLTAEEELERKAVQKQKLHEKDRMEEIIRRVSTRGHAAP